MAWAPRNAPERVEEWHDFDVISLKEEDVTRQPSGRSGFYLLKGRILVKARRISPHSKTSLPSSVYFKIQVAYRDGEESGHCGLMLDCHNKDTKGTGKTIDDIFTKYPNLDGLVGIKFYRRNGIPERTVNYLQIGNIPEPFEAAIKSGIVVEYRPLGQTV